MSNRVCKIIICGQRAMAEVNAATGVAAAAGRSDELQDLLDAELPTAQQDLAIQYLEKLITAYQNINQTLMV
jgi:flagellar hook-basal body complex protein FliE